MGSSCCKDTLSSETRYVDCKNGYKLLITSSKDLVAAGTDQMCISYSSQYNRLQNSTTHKIRFESCTMKYEYVFSTAMAMNSHRWKSLCTFLENYFQAQPGPDIIIQNMTSIPKPFFRKMLETFILVITNLPAPFKIRRNICIMLSDNDVVGQVHQDYEDIMKRIRQEAREGYNSVETTVVDYVSLARTQ